MRPSSFRRPLASSLALVLTLIVSAPLAATGDQGWLRGRVVEADGFTPRAGVVVALFDEKADRVFRSGPTDSEGAFRVAAAPASYAVLAETDAGAYVAAGAVQVDSGANPAVSLSLRKAAGPNYQISGSGGGGSATVGGLSRWAKWTIAGAIAVAGLVAINEVTDDEEEPASAF